MRRIRGCSLPIALDDPLDVPPGFLLAPGMTAAEMPRLGQSGVSGGMKPPLLLLLALLAACRANAARGDAASPPDAPKSCAQQLDELVPWFAAVVEDGRFLARALEGDLVPAAGALPLERGPVLEIGARGWTLSGEPMDEAALIERLPVERAQWDLVVGPKAQTPPILVAAAPDAEWGTIVRLVGVAGGAGFSPVSFVFLRPRAAAAPPRSPMSDRLEALRASPGDVMRKMQEQSELWAELGRNCPALRQRSAAVEGAEASEKLARLVAGSAEGLRECGCAGVASMRSVLWALVAGPSQWAVTVVVGAASARVIRAPAGARWREVAPEILRLVAKTPVEVALAVTPDME